MGTPRFDKLFHVLVVLGAASCADDDTSSRDRLTDAAGQPDDGDAAPAAGDGGVSTPDGGDELLPCFCNDDTATCCDRSGATPVVQDGFACCWSTTCE